jgi:septum formation protein
MQKIVLASKSPRRKQLLEWAEVPFQINVVDTDESFPAEFLPADAAIHIAQNKALQVAIQFPAFPILSADTIVVLDGDVIGKPVDRQDAISILHRLSGKVHHVITGVCILAPKREITFAETTKVEFHSLTTEEIIFYIDNYKPYDKAGAYAIQEWIGVVGIKSIEGDFYNVMGLPVSRVVRELKNL